MSERFHRIGLVANTEKPACAAAVRQAAQLIRASGREVLAETETARQAGLRQPRAPDLSTLARSSDLLLVFGGDGTMLRVAREMAPAPTPICGINLGGLGFLTSASSRQLRETLRGIWNGDATIENRALIEARNETQRHPLREVALNDFVVSRGATSRLIELEVTVDDQVLTRYRCDGMIISTPTGSTAYSLAAGGAIVSPDAAVMALTPICPHTLSNRSVIVSLDSVVGVRVLTRRLEVSLTADGQVQVPLSAGERVLIQRSRWQLRLIRLKGSSFFETLRQKLRWSGSNV